VLNANDGRWVLVVVSLAGAVAFVVLAARACGARSVS